MGLPKISVREENGALGRTAGTADGIAALLYSGVATARLALGEPKQLFGTADARALGLDADYDATHATRVWKNIKDFYAEAGEGAALWVMLYHPTTTMTTVADQDSDLARKCLDAGGGLIRLLAIGRTPDAAYAGTANDGLDDDVTAAVNQAQALAEAYAGQFMPVRVLLDGRDYRGDAAGLVDLKGFTANRVQVLLSTDEAGSKNAAVGRLLGRYARLPVQRNPGRIKDGDTGTEAAFFTDGTTPIERVSPGEQNQLHNKGFVFLRRWQSKNGYFFTDDPTATAASDDYSSFARGRVIDKARVIIHATYVEELLDDLEVDEAGRMAPAVAKSYQANIDNALNRALVDTGEASAVRSIIDPAQNVLATDRLVVSLKIRPKFYSKTIDVTLGFENPAAS